MTVGTKGSEPNLVDSENKRGPNSALAPTTAVVQVAPEADPFMVQIDKDDPNHAMVRISCILSLRGWTGFG